MKIFQNANDLIASKASRKSCYLLHSETRGHFNCYRTSRKICLDLSEVTLSNTGDLNFVVSPTFLALLFVLRVSFFVSLYVLLLILGYI